MAVINAFRQDPVDRAEPLTVAAAYSQCRDAALAESVIGAIGLEIESHLVDLDHVADPVPWKRVEAMSRLVPSILASCSRPDPPARASRPARSSRGLPGGSPPQERSRAPMNVNVILLTSQGHHPANQLSAIPTRTYESGKSGSGHGHDAAPA